VSVRHQLEAHKDIQLKQSSLTPPQQLQDLVNFWSVPFQVELSYVNGSTRICDV
jgi:hypothetical protein